MIKPNTCVSIFSLVSIILGLLVATNIQMLHIVQWHPFLVFRFSRMNNIRNVKIMKPYITSHGSQPGKKENAGYWVM